MKKISKQKQNYKTNEQTNTHTKETVEERARACDQSGEKGYEEKEKFKTIIIIIVVVVLLVVVVVQTRLRAVTGKTLLKTKRQMK